MRRFIMVAFLFTVLPAHGAQVTLGAGIEARIGHDVNPDVTETMGVGQLYFSLAQKPFAAVLEVSRSERNSETGNYSIQDVYYTTMAWGRYEPWSDLKVAPYAGIGMGWEFHNVATRFGSATDNRWADSGNVLGVGGGLTTTLFDHWNMEGEARAEKFALIEQPVWAFLFRTGYTF